MTNSVRSRSSTADGRIVIAGTGRTGTTLLVQILTALNFDTGFTLEDATANIDRISHAGLEHAFSDEFNPYVIKSATITVAEALKERGLKIHAAIIPMRDLFAAAESRRRVYHAAAAHGLDPLKQPGTLLLTQDPAWQEIFLAVQLYNTVFPLVQFRIPTYLLEFPRFARDVAYLYRALEPLLSSHGVTLQELRNAHRAVVKPELIHQFEPAR